MQKWQRKVKYLSKLLDANNQVDGLSGLNWFGFETSNYAPYGLEAQVVAIPR